MPKGEIVWLASYPKSGNTWVRLLLGNLLKLKDENEDEEAFAPVDGIASGRWTFDRHLGINTYDLTDAEIDMTRPDVYRCLADSMDTVQYIKTHDSFGRLPDGRAFFDAGRTRAALYMVRDPMDVAVSYAHFQGDQNYAAMVKKMGDARRTMGGGKAEQLRQHLGDWSGHYRSWTEQDDIPVLVIRYEDLKSDTGAVLEKIVEFLGLDKEELAMSVDEAVEAARFDRLQSIEDKVGFAEKPDSAKRFFRSGKTGEGREQLSKNLQDILVTQHGKVMRELGYL